MKIWEMYALGRWIKYAKRDKERGQRAKKPKEGKRKAIGRQKEWCGDR
jgi:hypothetical protein